MDAIVSPNEAATRRVVTQVIGGKFSRTSHTTCGATADKEHPGRHPRRAPSGNSRDAWDA